MDKTARYDSLFTYWGEQYGQDWRLLKAQAIAESGLDPDAISPAKAIGLTQFLKNTFAEWVDGTPGIQGSPGWSRRNPEAAIRAQAAYMQWLLSQCRRAMRDYGGGAGIDAPQGVVQMMALAAYNWGIGRVRRAIIRHGLAWRIVLPQETTQYLARIAKTFERLTGQLLVST